MTSFLRVSLVLRKGEKLKGNKSLFSVGFMHCHYVTMTSFLRVSLVLRKGEKLKGNKSLFSVGFTHS